MLNDQMIDGYAFGKLSELVYEIFVGLEPAREKLSNNLHFIAIISPTDFKQEKHRAVWRELQKRLLGKTRNIGLQRAPDERLTVQNKTLEYALTSIFKIYEECASAT